MASRVVAVLSLLALLADAQLQRQCTCGEFEPCRQSATNPNSFIQCFDRCQNHIAAQGASYPDVRQCILNYLPQLTQTASCVERSIGQVCAATPGFQVPKRYPQTTELAAFREINSMLAASGLQAEATTLLHAARAVAGCVGRCVQTGGGACLKQLGCGLALPSDNVLVATVKQCAMAAGFTTPTVRDICSCLTSAGLRQLGNMCPRIIIQ